ncbi:MAG: hypothetical protein JXA98_08895 [Methanosarcinaceae archaeon]|nr:hypothetical protein [Methanosarcinaceae archaeon]
MLKNAANDYNEDKYSEEFYTYHLKILQNAYDINESVSRAVKYLFLWKLGKVRSKQTPSSTQLKFSDSKRRQYYSIPITNTHQGIIKKAIEKERLENAIDFRDEVISYDRFKYCADELTSSTIVLPAFYIHIWRPEKFPILDEKVWKVFRDEKQQRFSRNTKPGSWDDYEAYTYFFKKIVDDTRLDWRTVDRGMWVFGHQLKKRIGNRSIKPVKDKESILLEHKKQEIILNHRQIPSNLLNKACDVIDGDLPYKYRGIMISCELIKTTMEILNAEVTKTLPQNCRNDIRERTPDGLDKRIKERLNTNLRTANIISDVLKSAGIVEIVQVINPHTNRIVKGTKLLQKWNW